MRDIGQWRIRSCEKCSSQFSVFFFFLCTGANISQSPAAAFYLTQDHPLYCKMTYILWGTIRQQQRNLAIKLLSFASLVLSILIYNTTIKEYIQLQYGQCVLHFKGYCWYSKPKWKQYTLQYTKTSVPSITKWWLLLSIFGSTVFDKDSDKVLNN